MKYCILCKEDNDEESVVELVICEDKESMYATLESLEYTHIYYRGRLDVIHYPL